MFQHASLKGIALLHGYRVCIPPIDAAGCREIKVRKSDANLNNVFELQDIEHRITGCITHRFGHGLAFGLTIQIDVDHERRLIHSLETRLAMYMISDPALTSCMLRAMH